MKDYAKFSLYQLQKNSLLIYIVTNWRWWNPAKLYNEGGEKGSEGKDPKQG